MQPFQTICSRAIPLDINHVDTDMIIPAQFLTQIGKDGYGKHVFKRLREQDSHCVFNDPQYQAAEILISKANFGCGSSREHAVWALQQIGLKVIIAESYSDIFYNNAAKNGLLLIILTQEVIKTLLQKVTQSDFQITVDLSQQIISTSDDGSYHFDYDPFRKNCLLKGQDDLDYLLEIINE